MQNYFPKVEKRKVKKLVRKAERLKSILFDCSFCDFLILAGCLSRRTCAALCSSLGSNYPFNDHSVCMTGHWITFFLHSSGQNSRLTINTVRDSSWLVDDWASPSYRPLPNRLPCHCLISKIWYWLTSYHPQIPMPKVPLKVATQFTQYLDFSSIACQNHSSHSDGLPLENPEPCLHLTVVPQFHEHAIWYRMPLTCRPCGLMSTTHLPPEINQKEAAYECTPHGTLLLLCKLMLKQDSSKTYQFQSQEPPARCHLSALLLKLSSAMVVPCIPQAGLYAARVDKQGAGLEIVSISQRTSSFFWDVLAWRKIVKSRRTPEWLACMLHRSQPDIMDVAAKP